MRTKKIETALTQARLALLGDSNDAEHDALRALVEALDDPPPLRHYLMHIFRDVEPHLHGPYKSKESRDKVARARAHNAPDDGFFKVETDATVFDLDSYYGDELKRPEARSTGFLIRKGNQ